MTKLILDIETTGLKPMTDKIASIAVMNVNLDKTEVFASMNEKELLEDFRDYLMSYGNDYITFLGFNTDSFDVPFIITRFMIHGFSLPKFKSKDLRKTVNGFFYSYNKNPYGTLADWAVVLGVPCKTLPGSFVPDLYAEGKIDEIKEHNVEDIIITKKLYDRAVVCGLIDDDYD